MRAVVSRSRHEDTGSRTGVLGIGSLVNFRLISEQTAGNFSLVELSSFPGEGVPSHLHTDREEGFTFLTVPLSSLSSLDSSD
jgi:hypothetical protein